VISLVEIRVNDSESLDSALKRFNRKVQSDGILTDSRQNEYYEKPSEKRKKKEAQRIRKIRKMNRKTDFDYRK
jgi:small subunit ribosomal protein S21